MSTDDQPVPFGHSIGMPYAEMKLPRGGVSLKVEHNRISIWETVTRRRRWMFWRRETVSEQLATTECRVRQGLSVSLEQRGPGHFIALVDGDIVLRWPGCDHSPEFREIQPVYEDSGPPVRGSQWNFATEVVGTKLICTACGEELPYSMKSDGQEL